MINVIGEFWEQFQNLKAEGRLRITVVAYFGKTGYNLTDRDAYSLYIMTINKEELTYGNKTDYDR